MKGKAREMRRTNREVREDKQVAVVLLLRHLGFLHEDDGHVSATIMRDFRKRQRPSLFFGANAWPPRLQDQIGYLYERLDEAWVHK